MYFGFEDCTHEFLHKNGNSETTCNNRLAAIRAYLWYVADYHEVMESTGKVRIHPYIWKR